MIWCKEPRCRSWSYGVKEGHEHDFARRKLGESTGLCDGNGIEIFEGDILEQYYNEFYGKVRVVVRWCHKKGAWISEGEFASGSGGGHESLNGEHFSKCERLGNIDRERQLYYPHLKLSEMAG